MRLTRCFHPGPLQTGAVVTLPPAAAAHLTRVLRLRAGAALTLFDGRGGEFAAELLEGSRQAVPARVGERRAVEREASVRVTLLQCLARAERMDWIVQKATELGVAQIVPLVSAHSVVQMDSGGAARRVAHWQAIAVSACEQCGRNRLPAVHGIRALPDAFQTLPSDGLRLLLSPEAQESLPAALTAAIGPAPVPRDGESDGPGICLLVGPEGGLAEVELAAARQHGFRPCRLGPRILRAETAPLAALAAIHAAVGDFV